MSASVGVIASRDNPRYKVLHKLAVSAPARRAAQRTLIEGAHLCASYLEHVGVPEQCVLAESALSAPEVARIAAAVAARDQLVLTDPLYRSLSQLEQGLAIAFVVAIPVAPLPERIEASAILIDRLQDPGNLGSILRSAAAAGVGAVFCGKGSVGAWSPKVLRAGMGAHFALSIAEECDLLEVMDRTRIPVYVTSPHAARSLYRLDLAAPVAWVFGNEGQGVAPQIEARAQGVAIPQPGRVESLNVAAAAAICLFEAVRQQT